MKHDIGLHISQKETSVGVVHGVFEGKAHPTPGALAELIGKRSVGREKIGIETDATARWLWHDLRRIDLAAVWIDA